MELKDFALVEIEPGESQTVTFEITTDKLSFIGSGKDYKSLVEKGDFTLFIGKSSSEYQVADFKLK